MKDSVTLCRTNKKKNCSYVNHAISSEAPHPHFYTEQRKWSFNNRKCLLMLLCDFVLSRLPLGHFHHTHKTTVNWTVLHCCMWKHTGLHCVMSEVFVIQSNYWGTTEVLLVTTRGCSTHYAMQSVESNGGSDAVTVLSQLASLTLRLSGPSTLP